MISEQDSKYVADLARIHLRDDEVSRLTQNLEAILEYVHKLNKVDVSGVEPTSHVLPIQNVLREDELKNSLSQNETLAISVEKKDGSFKVPKVIE